MKSRGFFQKIFSLISQTPGWLYFFLSMAAPSSLHTAKWLRELPPSSACMRTLLAVTTKVLHLGKHTAEHHSTSNSILKTSLSVGSKNPTKAAWFLRNQGRPLQCQAAGQVREGYHTISMSKGTCVVPLSGLSILYKPLLRAQPGPLGDSNSCWEAAGDVAAPASSNIQNTASGCPVAFWISPWSI